MERLITRSQGLFYGPSAGQSFCQRLWSLSDLSCPRTQQLCMAVMSQRPISARIQRLFLLTGPAAIVRRIWPVIVDTLNRVAFGTWSHITYERDRIVDPISRHRNASTAITRIRFAVRLIAAFFNASPDTILRCFRQAMCAISAFISETSAAFRPAEPKRDSVYILDLSAGALTGVSWSRLIRGWDFIQHGPSMECRSGTYKNPTFRHPDYCSATEAP